MSLMQTDASLGLKLMRRTTGLMLAAIVLGFLSGCGLSENQRDAVAKFSGAASAMGDSTVAQIVDARETVITLNTHYMALRPGENPKTFDGALTPEAVGARVKAGRTIKTYAELLKALVGESQADQLRAASNKFIGSVRALDKNEQAISDDNLDIIGKIVAGIGGLWVDNQKAKAVKRIVPMAHPHVVKIGNLLANEFSASSGAIPSYLDARARKVLIFAGEVLENKKVPVADRIVAAEAKKFGLTAQQKANLVLPSVSDAAKKMVKAHELLVEALKSDRKSISSIKEFVKSVEDLIAATAVF